MIDKASSDPSGPRHKYFHQAMTKPEGLVLWSSSEYPTPGGCDHVLAHPWRSPSYPTHKSLSCRYKTMRCDWNIESWGSTGLFPPPTCLSSPPSWPAPWGRPCWSEQGDDGQQELRAGHLGRHWESQPVAPWILLCISHCSTAWGTSWWCSPPPCTPSLSVLWSG